MLSFTEDLPHIAVSQSHEASHLEFQKVILIWVQINRMDTTRALLKIVEDVVTGTGDGQNDIVSLDIQQAVVNAGIFPIESIDVLISKLSVFWEEVIVEDTVVVILVKGRRERQVRA